MAQCFVVKEAGAYVIKGCTGYDYRIYKYIEQYCAFSPMVPIRDQFAKKIQGLANLHHTPLLNELSTWNHFAWMRRYGCHIAYDRDGEGHSV